MSLFLRSLVAVYAVRSFDLQCSIPGSLIPVLNILGTKPAISVAMERENVCEELDRVLLELMSSLQELSALRMRYAATASEVGVS